MSVLGKQADIDDEGLVTLSTKLNGRKVEVPSHPSLVTEWSNEDLHPNTVLYVFLKKIRIESYERMQIWNLQYFAPGKCKKLDDCDCLLCKQYLTVTTSFNKGLLTSKTPKNDVHFIRNGLSLSCKSENVIYLVTCKKCGLQYVGKSKYKMRTRFQEHLTDFEKSKKDLMDGKLLYNHFRDHSPIDPLENLSLVIIDQITNKHSISINKLRQYWINRLDTFYRGLNAKTGSSTTRSQQYTPKTNLLQDDNNNMIVKQFLEGLETK
eukprot:TCONS_00070750-protein